MGRHQARPQYLNYAPIISWRRTLLHISVRTWRRILVLLRRTLARTWQHIYQPSWLCASFQPWQVRTWRRILQRQPKRQQQQLAKRW